MHLLKTPLLRPRLAALLLLPLVGCGGGDSPTTPSTAAPTTVGGDLNVTVFYDENGNGVVDPSEGTRLPDVMVEAGGKNSRTVKGSGRGTISAVPGGSQSVSIRTSSLPAYYRAGAAVTVTLPQDANREILIPVTLSIGSNRPNVYFAFGDSITDGDGSRDRDGYRGKLEMRLVQQLNRANVNANGNQGTTSAEGAARIGPWLRDFRPAYMLILYGTNDWNTSACNSDIGPCFTASAIRSMIQQTKAAGSLPIVSTITPANTGYDARTPPDRNIRVQQQNDQIRSICQAEGVPVAESYNAFMTASAGNLRSLFVDHVHPNDSGHDLIAQSFFEAITRATGGNAASFGEPPEIAFAPSRFKKAGSEGRIPFAPTFPEGSAIPRGRLDLQLPERD